ncbi:hypothetical protein C8R44DRAFT_884888 [Mycena epipterygia]|nr:hypothetical protein C8R44DRAFT_884888 [Mycena epipterygia]
MALLNAQKGWEAAKRPTSPLYPLITKYSLTILALPPSQLLCTSHRRGCIAPMLIVSSSCRLRAAQEVPQALAWGALIIFASMAIVPICSRLSATVCLFSRVAGVGRDRDMGAMCTPIRRLKVITVPVHWFSREDSLSVDVLQGCGTPTPLSCPPSSQMMQTRFLHLVLIGSCILCYIITLNGSPTATVPGKYSSSEMLRF